MSFFSALRNYFGNSKKAPIGLLLLAALVLAATALFFFGWLAEEVLEGDAKRFDDFVSPAVHSVASPTLTRIMQDLSLLGSVAGVAILTILAASLFFYFHLYRAAVFLVVIWSGAAILDLTLKHAFHRPRPIPYFGLAPASFSFPSGHALGSLCFYSALAIILTARTSRATRIFIWAVAVLLIAGIGLSRIYLGVHYPSDVLAGYSAAVVWVGMVFAIDKLFEPPAAKGPELPLRSAGLTQPNAASTSQYHL
jgi:membrane-associated phospholipid phosphatase